MIQQNEPSEKNIFYSTVKTKKERVNMLMNLWDWKYLTSY